MYLVNKTPEQKRHTLFVVLAGIFLTNAIVAELIGVKIFSGEQTLGLDPAHLNIFGFVMDFNLTAGAVIWPVVFITSDLINEYFGKPGVKRISYLAAIFIAYSFLVIFLTMKLPPAQWWMEANSKDAAGNYFNMDFAFNKILGQGQRIIVASLAAFLIGQLVDVFVFQKLRKITGSKMLWLRATGSTLVSQFIDSFVVLYLAFSGIFSNGQIVAIGITNYLYKFTVAILLTPLIYAGHYIIDKYLGKEDAEKLSEESANQSSSFF
ncbi:MAG: queuosine precursor transporter [Bacteroidetes bacterium]|nr:queuosine precursor transporter [Bacteroidota bacterium]